MVTKAGIYAYGQSNLIWVDERGEVINGAYHVKFVDGGARVVLKGRRSGDPDLYAERVADVPTKEECKSRHYNSVLNYVQEQIDNGKA